MYRARSVGAIRGRQCAMNAGVEVRQMRCRTRNERRPLEAVLQGKASNSRMLRRPKAWVVSVTEKVPTTGSCKDQKDERK